MIFGDTPFPDSVKTPEQKKRFTEILDKAWRGAQLRAVCRASVTADQLGMYALHRHADAYSPAVWLYLLDRRGRLCREKLLFSGFYPGMEPICLAAEKEFRNTPSAAMAALSMTAEQKSSVTEADIEEISRAYMYFAMKKIPVFELYLITDNTYLPLCRASGIEKTPEKNTK